MYFFMVNPIKLILINCQLMNEDRLFKLEFPLLS